MKYIAEPFMALKKYEIFYHISCDGMEVQKFNVLESGTLAGAEEPFVLRMDEIAMFMLIHGWQEDCCFRVMGYPLR